MFCAETQSLLTESPCCHGFTLNSEFLPSACTTQPLVNKKNLTKYLLLQAFQVPILIKLLEGLGPSVPWIIFWKPKKTLTWSRADRRKSHVNGASVQGNSRGDGWIYHDPTVGPLMGNPRYISPVSRGVFVGYTSKSLWISQELPSREGSHIPPFWGSLENHHRLKKCRLVGDMWSFPGG